MLISPFFSLFFFFLLILLLLSFFWERERKTENRSLDDIDEWILFAMDGEEYSVEGGGVRDLSSTFSTIQFLQAEACFCLGKKV